MKDDAEGGSPLIEALDRLSAETDDHPTVGRLLDDIGRASFGYMLFAPALVVVTPLSGIPGLSSLCGIAIALTAAQMLIGREHIWLPSFILDRKIARDRLRQGLDWMRRPLGWLDGVTRPRLRWLLRRPFVLVLELASLACGAAMPVLELVPLTSSLLGAAVLTFSISMVTRDGVFALAGFAVILGAAALIMGIVGN